MCCPPDPKFNFKTIAPKFTRTIYEKKVASKSLSGALIFDQLIQNMTTDCFCLINQNNLCTQHVLSMFLACNSLNNLLSYCGLVDARISASEKDLPVQNCKKTEKEIFAFES